MCNNMVLYFASEYSGKVHVSRSVYLPSIVKHTHDYIELICITEGTGYHISGCHKLPAKPGDIFLVDYNVTHTYRSMSNNFTWINCIFQPENIMWDYQASSGLEVIRSIAKANGWEDTVLCAEILQQNLMVPEDDLIPLFQNMLREYRQGDPCVVLPKYLYIVMSKITRHLCQKQNFSYLAELTAPKDNANLFGDVKNDLEEQNRSPIIQDVLNRINRNLQFQINAKQLAEYYTLSQSQFSQLFHREMGCTFSQYMISLRMHNAGYLLRESDANINEIVNLTGYTDNKTFYHNFKKYYGCTPSEYRKNMKSTK